MNMYGIIESKASGQVLSYEELEYFTSGLCSGEVPDYQASALIMAIFINGMTEQETADFTLAIARSGDQVDLSPINGIKVDKHSTGGIGDKTTLIIGPIIAACGGKIAKMSGRGLGYSGGTIDKLESIPGMKTSLTDKEFIDGVNTIGMAITGQTANAAPADKKIYAIRDVTAAVNSIPLIASSVMSKKLASGADKFVLDVKAGSGAFVKTFEDARKLAETMVKIGSLNGKETVAVITNMNRPLGKNVGNLLEVQEALETLKGQGPRDLTEVSVELSAMMMKLAGMGTLEECRRKAEQSIHDGTALQKFKEFVQLQGGRYEVIENPRLFYEEPSCKIVKAEKSGYFNILSAENIGKASVLLGAGRLLKEDEIDFTAGIVFNAVSGSYVKKGEELYRFYAADAGKISGAEKAMKEAVACIDEEPAKEKLILDIVENSSLTGGC